jgi:hypothetical protein
MAEGCVVTFDRQFPADSRLTLWMYVNSNQVILRSITVFDDGEGEIN